MDVHGPVADVVESYTVYVVAPVTAGQVTVTVVVVEETQVAAALAGAGGVAGLCASPLLLAAREIVHAVAAMAIVVAPTNAIAHTMSTLRVGPRRVSTATSYSGSVSLACPGIGRGAGGRGARGRR
jgi:hypothetical protein